MGSVLFKRSVVWFALIQAFKGGLTPAPALAHELPTCSLPSAFLVVEWSKRFIPLIEQDLLSPHSTALFPITTARELRQMGAVANPRSILMRALIGDESNRPQLRPDPESPDRFYALARDLALEAILSAS